MIDSMRQNNMKSPVQPGMSKRSRYLYGAALLLTGFGGGVGSGWGARGLDFIVRYPGHILHGDEFRNNLAFAENSPGLACIPDSHIVAGSPYSNDILKSDPSLIPVGKTNSGTLGYINRTDNGAYAGSGQLLAALDSANTAIVRDPIGTFLYTIKNGVTSPGNIRVYNSTSGLDNESLLSTGAEVAHGKTAPLQDPWANLLPVFDLRETAAHSKRSTSEAVSKEAPVKKVAGFRRTSSPQPAQKTDTKTSNPFSSGKSSRIEGSTTRRRLSPSERRALNN